MNTSVKTMALRDELLEIFAALHIQTFESFSFRGQLYSTQFANQQGLTEALGNVLYSQCYTRSRASEANPVSDQAFLNQLIQTRQTVDRWDAGWTIYQILPDGRILVQKGERSRAAVQGEYATNKPPGFPPQHGDVVNLRVHPSSASIQPGFYHAFGNTLSDQFDESALIRFYFNVSSTGAPLLMGTLVFELNRFQVPFSYKTLSSPAAYVRADAAVLYCAKRYHRVVSNVLLSLSALVAAELRTETPMFTSTLRPGVGVAEEPGTGESFGMHRCRLVAEGMVSAYLLGDSSPEACLRAVEERFSKEAIRLDQPWLHAGSVNFLQHLTEARVA